MKILKSTIKRCDDFYYINIDMLVETSIVHDTCNILFKNNDNIIYVLSATNGYINNNTVILSNTHKSLMISLEHESDIEDLECFVSYYDNNYLIDFFSETITIDKISSISPSVIRANKLNSVDTNIFDKKLQTFSNMMAKKIGSCSLNVEVKEDIIITVLNAPSKNIYLSFGEMTTKIAASDIIFSLYENIKKIIIPKEMIWKLYSEYSNNAELGCFEIVSPAFCSIKNIYYKTPVSNIISISDIPRMKKNKLEYFKDPMNRDLNANKWYIGSTNLPIYRDS